MSVRIGVYICECGPNIAENIDIATIIKTIPILEADRNITMIVKPYKLLCSNEGKEFLEEEIKANHLTHLVVAACSPRDHDTTFMNICKKTKLNPYLYQLVNIREQCAWIIPDKKEATDKAIRSIRAGVRRVLRQTELSEKRLDSNPDVLVIGGGIAGIEATLYLVGSDRHVYLIEKKEELGGRLLHYQGLQPQIENYSNIVQKKISDIQNHENIHVLTNTELENIVGFFGNFEVLLKNVQEDIQTNITVGAIVVATGFSLCNIQDLTKFKYNKENDVYTSLEFEEKLSKNEKILLKSGDKPKSVALIHCVGRDEMGYCSNICCKYLFRIAQSIKEADSDIDVKEFYKDLCVPYKGDQQIFDKTREMGVDFIRFKDISLNGTHIQYMDMDNDKKEISVDMVILALAMVPAEGTSQLAEKLNVSLNETGFYQEAHPVLNPVATVTEGIFIVGAARGPSGISESMLQAQAASGKILTQLIPGEKIIPEVKVSEVLEDFCTGCQTCLDVCCYGAIFFDEQRGISVVNEVVCRGCGNCAASCPSGAIRAKHFTNPQIYQEVIEAVR